MRESAEMYLETIHILNSRLGKVRAIDIVKYMNLSKPSVSKGLKNLLQRGFVERDEKRLITLTPKGEKKARVMYNKNITITKFLQILGVEYSTAQKDACKIEHILSPMSFDCITNFVSKQEILDSDANQN